MEVCVYIYIYIFFFRLNRQNPGNFSHLTDLFETSNGLFFTILFTQKKINENKAREQGGINLIVSVQTRKTQGISTPLRILFFFPLD